MSTADTEARQRVRVALLGRRLVDALERKIGNFERRLDTAAPGDAASAADAERDARTLNTLVRLFHKLEALSGPPPAGAAKAAAASAAAQAGDQKTGDHDADRLRHALAQRLETLRVSLAD